ncbi:MAG: serine protease [Anaerolineae bacterium]
MMKRALFVLILLLALPSLVFAQERLSSSQINLVAQSVVQILNIQNGQPVEQGSGTIIDAAGYIFTNVHVIENGDDFAILQSADPGELPELRYFASVVQTYPDIDFAVLQIDRDANGRRIDASTLSLQALPLAEVNPSLGDPVFVFGFPSIGDGYLAFTNGSITTIQNADFGQDRAPLLYQTNAEIAPGNSGGTAVNASGEFIGIPSSVQAEDRTGGRLGQILSVAAIRYVLEGTNTRDLQPQQPNQPTPDLPALQDTAPTPSPDYSQLDYRLESNYGGMQLAAGFTPDPLVVEVISGVAPNAAVDISAQQYGDFCVGYSTPQPDYRIRWSGSTEGLRFFFYNQNNGDAALIVNLPDGSWQCSDDSFNTLLPTVDVINPPEGQYDIWVASYNSSENLPGYLVITADSNITPITFGQTLPR